MLTNLSHTTFLSPGESHVPAGCPGEESLSDCSSGPASTDQPLDESMDGPGPEVTSQATCNLPMPTVPQEHHHYYRQQQQNQQQLHHQQSLQQQQQQQQHHHHHLQQQHLYHQRMFPHGLPYPLPSLTQLHQDEGQHNSVEEKMEAQASSQPSYFPTPISIEPPPKHEPPPSPISPIIESPAVSISVTMPSSSPGNNNFVQAMNLVSE